MLITEKKSNYLNKDIPYLTNVSIYEYDMSSGGFNILCSKGVFDKKEEQRLINMEKLERNVYIGKKLRKEPELSSILIEGFKEYLTEFCVMNNIENKDILSIKKDAIFVINKKCNKLKVNKYVSLKEANKYTSYLYVNNIEFYNNTNTLDVKGLKDDVTNNNAFLGEIKKIMTLMEKNNEIYLFRYLRKLQKDYLEYNVDYALYKELNINNAYKVSLFDHTYYYDNIDEDFIDYININYNYFSYIQEIIRMLV